ncbi:uncharacterized protein B0H18DRAFT_542476 [Fomitopsis serialis]|uniref:uncharacterized protein n=1 Tax=Fomitopsis serialis TaxID=139415 RepID=UPI0020077F15|nr:uncharacterized protein B0H18DRAFT_542476 [Neoantrodia serialis]KAH9921627.1 hypothetical protein B0H18DRAFT_542476 [Neoantrodia serialis]
MKTARPSTTYYASYTLFILPTSPTRWPSSRSYRQHRSINSPQSPSLWRRRLHLCHMQSEVLSTYAVACRFHLYKAKEVASVAFSASLPTRAEDGSGIYWRRIHRIDEFVPAMLTIPARAYYNILVRYQASKTGCDAEQGFSVFMSFIMSMDHPPQPSPVDQRPQCPQPSPIFAPLPPPPFDHRAPRTFTPDHRLIPTQGTNGQEICLIRSVDGTDFHLNAYIISFASPVIADMLTAATASSNSDGGQAVAGTAGLRRVDLPEWSDTLSDLLQLCHPLPNPEVKTFRLRTLLHAALKYKVQHAIAFVKEVYVQMAEQKPLHVYFIATSHDWQDVVKLAAIYSVYGTVWPKMDELYGEIGTLLDELPASAYRRLLVYCQKCRNLILASRASSPKGAEAPYWSDVEGTQWASDEESKVWRALHTKAFEKAMSGQAEANVDAEEVDLTALPTGKDPRDGATVTRSGNTTVRCSHREIMHVVEKLMKVRCERAFACSDRAIGDELAGRLEDVLTASGVSDLSISAPPNFIRHPTRVLIAFMLQDELASPTVQLINFTCMHNRLRVFDQQQRINLHPKIV